MIAVAELKVYGDIGSWYGARAVTADAFTAQLDEITDNRLTVRINSGGGDVFEALAIYNALARHPAYVTVQIDGLAASAASMIAMAADEIVMARNARIMVHDAWSCMAGNAAELTAEAERMDGLSDMIADIYTARAGGTAAGWRDVMRRETWYTAEQAVEAGLADQIEARSGVVAASVTGRPQAAAMFTPAAAVAATPVTGRPANRRARAVAVARARRTRSARSISTERTPS